MFWLPKFCKDPNKSSLLRRLRNANVPNESSFRGLLKTCNLFIITTVTSRGAKKCSQTSRATIGKVQREQLNFCNFLSLAFFQPVSAALLLLETAVIAPVWLVIQLGAFLTLFGNGCVFDISASLNKQHKDSSINFYTLLI